MTRQQRGSVAIEFAIMFPLFLLILYGIISYAICFAVMISLHGLSGDAARAVVSVDQSTLSWNAEEVDTAVAEEVDRVLEGSWLNSDLIQGCEQDGGRYKMGENGELDVCLRVNIGRDSDPGIGLPRINLLGIEIPHLDHVASSSSIRL